MNKILIAGIVAVIIVGGSAYAYLTQEPDHIGEMMTYTESMPENSSMGDGHENHMTSQGVQEKAFVEHMIPHHQEAVDTAKQVVARGEDSEVKALAEGIITAQEKEIADMKSWYEAWYGTPYKDTGSYQPMMRDLDSLSGKELDTAFLEDMIMHHMGALNEAQAVAPNIQHQEILTLAKAIAETQSNEIITMRIILKRFAAANSQ